MGFGNAKRMELAKAILRQPKKTKKKTRQGKSSVGSKASAAETTSSASKHSTASPLHPTEPPQLASRVDESFSCIVNTLDCKHTLRVQEIWEEVKRKIGNDTLATQLMFRARALSGKHRNISMEFSSDYAHQCKVLIESLDSIIQLLGPDMDEDDTGYHTWRLVHKGISVEAITQVLPDCLNAMFEGTLTENDIESFNSTVCRLMIRVLEDL